MYKRIGWWQSAGSESHTAGKGTERGRCSCRCQTRTPVTFGTDPSPDHRSAPRKLPGVRHKLTMNWPFTVSAWTDASSPSHWPSSQKQPAKRWPQWGETDNLRLTGCSQTADRSGLPGPQESSRYWRPLCTKPRLCRTGSQALQC